jgi:sialate O-acetylesterase
VNTIALSFPNGLPPAGNYTLMTYGATNGSGTLALNGSYLNTTLAVTSTNVQLIVSSTNSSLTWQGQNSGTWDTTTTNWISGSSPADFSNGSQVTFDDTASSFAVTNSGVLPATVTLNNSLNNYTFTSSGGGISGSTGLTKYGTGTLTLNGANSFSGDMVINGGSVMLGNASALAGSTVAINLANGLGFAVNAVTLGNLNGSGSFALNNGASPVNLTLGGNNASTIYSGNLTGTGSLIKTGAGIFTLTGNNAIGGNTTVSNGTLVVNGSLAANALNVFGSTLSGTGTITGPVTVGAGGTLFPTGNWVIHGAVSLGAGSTTVMQLGTAATMVRGVSSLTYGGTLVITNTTGASLVAGSSFKIFDAAPYSGSFTSSNLPPLGTGLSWYLNDLTNYGTIRVVSAWTVAGMFNNNMVLQRGISVPVWGTALPGQSVTVTFGGQTKTTTAGTDRKWLVRLDAMAANTNAQSLTVTIAGSTTNTYSNVLVGEVWLAAGQSNMVLPLQSMTNATAEIAAANYPLMRRLPVPNTASGGSITPIWQMSSTPWEVCSPTTAPNWSGAAYFFARNLFTNLNVPVGILQSAVNGTTAETRTSFEALEAVPELKTMADQELEQYYEGNVVIGSTATGLFNTMIWPLIPFGICGAIYYQGEANSTTSDRCQQYRVLLPAMIQDWRSRWQQADFPFYIVQLPNYSSTLWPYLREAQMLTLQTVTNTGLAVTIDVGDATVLHPTDKQDVGARLADLALNRNYGFTNVVASGPIFRNYAIEGGQIRLYFDYADGGLMTGQKNGLDPVQELVGVAPLWFEIAGTNQIYYLATVLIDTNNTVVLSSPSVPYPALARYAWSANPQGTNLYNRAGLPVSPFRIPAWSSAPPISSIELGAGSVQSVCAVPTNVTWWVEFNSGLSGTPWLPLVQPQTGTGSAQTVTDPINGNARRFYRWCQMP